MSKEYSRVTFSGHQVRLGRLFDPESGRSFITAMDHGVTLGVPEGLEDVASTVERIIAGQPDGVLIGPGIFQKTSHLFAHRGAPATILRIDFFLNHPYLDVHGEAYRTLISPSEAGVMGADAVIMFLMLGSGGANMFADNIHHVAKAVQEAHRAGLPLIVEAVLWGSHIENKKDPDQLAFACRMAVEIGADAIKTEYTGDRESMAEIIRSTPAPVLVLGGAKSASPNALLDATRDAMAAGAHGVIYGRNVWQADDPVAIASELRQIIHSAPPVARPA
jgi:DhnA family fructose-bisphosphate aldolase class Ia